MPAWALAGGWGLLAASALPLGALLGWFIRFSPKSVAYIMAFGSGILISALSFELVGAALEKSSIWPVITGFMAGALIFSLINRWINSGGSKHRKRSHHVTTAGASGLAIAAGTLLDGVPESVAIGVLVAGGGGLSLVTVAAIFISNIPEALSSTAGLRRAGRSGTYIATLWGGMALLSGVMAIVGALFFGAAPVRVHAFITCLAAGGIFAMLVETMIPEAFAEAHEMSGLAGAVGFLTAIALQTLETSGA